MDDQLETREDAIRFLRAAGFHAFARDWSLGESIGVASHPSDSEELVVWERMLYIAPEPGGWALYDLRRPAVFPGELLPLRDACELAITALKEEIVPEVPRRSSPTSPATDANDAVEDGYFCTFERKPGRYDVGLESPAPPGSTLPYVQVEAFDDVDFDTLAAIVSQHLHLEHLNR